MARYFLDSSALAKAYHAETGTAVVAALLADLGNEFYISSLTVIEMQSVFSQKVREGRINEADYSLLKQRFSADIQSKRLKVKNLLRVHQQLAEALLERHAKTRRLRTLDAIQPAAALELTKSVAIDHFVCADQHLNNVAIMEGCSVINPDQP